MKYRHILRICSILTAISMLSSFGSIGASAVETDAEISINADNFPDAAFRQYIFDNLDIDKSGTLSESEMADDAAMALNVSDCGIVDLTGISYFSNLMMLDCSGNLLETLDLSQNQALWSVNCNNNRLIELNVSNCSNLMVLSCANNQLSEIQLEGCVGLSSVSCDGNQIAALNLNGNTALSNFSGENNVVSMDVQWDDAGDYYYVQLPESVDMSCIDVQSASVLPAAERGWLLLSEPVDSLNYTYLVQPDTSHQMTVTLNLTYPAAYAVSLTEFPDAGFRRYLSDNYDSNADGMLSPVELYQIQNMDISGYDFTDLTGIQLLRYLRVLNCSSLPLTSLDVSNMDTLQELYCNDCYLETLTLTGALNLTTLDCSGNQLKTLDLMALSKLSGLRCGNNQLTALQISSSTANGEFFDANHNSTIIPVVIDGGFPLAELPDFDDTKLVPDSLQNAVLEDGMLLVTDPSKEITYEYYVYQDDAKQVTVTFTLIPNEENLEINEKNFPDEQFRRIISTYDLDEDGFFSRTELETVTVLEMPNQNIELLTGISYFRNLLVLDVSDNQLRSLDLSALSQLTSVNCSGNALNSLMFGEASHLETLNCSKNTTLTALDVSCMTALQTLDCADCRLQLLDLSGADKLVSLDCGHNALTSLVLPESCLLEKLYCNSNKLTSLDLSNMTSLRQLNCSMNTLELLDTSSLSALEELVCASDGLTMLDVSGCQNLVHLNCSNNKLTALDVSGLTNLSTLDCLSNQLCCLNLTKSQYSVSVSAHLNLCTVQPDMIGRIRTQLLPGGFDVERVVQSSLTNAVLVGDDLYVTDLTQNVTYDYIVYSGIKPVTVSFTLVPEAASSDVLVPLDEVHFPDEVFRKELVIYDSDWDNCLSRQEISIADSLSLSGKGIKDLTGIEYLTALEYLDCTGNQLTDLCLINLPELKELNCSGNQLTELQLINLPSLQTLLCDYNALSALDVTNLSALSYFSCVGNQLTELHVSGLPDLTHLYCQENQITELELTQLSQLQYLQCADNQLTALELSDLTNLLELQCQNNHLTFLDVSASTERVSVSTEGNSHVISVKANSLFDLSGIAGGFDAANVVADSWENAVCMDGVLHITDLNQPVTYTYLVDTEKDITAPFTLIPELVEENVLPIDAVNFPDEAFRSYILENLDVNNDTYLADSEIELVTEMNISGLGIKALTGLSVFTRLEKLDCSDNLLTSLDDLSNSTLKFINCSDNQLASVSLDALSELEYLNCDNNALTTLNLSSVHKLTYLSCRRNQLSELNLYPVTELETLCCSDNPLEILELYKNTKLKHLECARMKLDNLMVQHQPLLEYLDCSEIGMYYLYLGDNHITELDCHGNYLYQLETKYLSYLEKLDCSDNVFASLDLSAQDNLRELHADNNPMYALKLSSDAPIETYTLENCGRDIVPVLSEENDLQFDLKNLTGLDPEMCFDWTNAQQSGDTISIYHPLKEMTYLYDTGNEAVTPMFTLKMQQVPIGAAEITVEEHEDFLFRDAYYTPKAIVRMGDLILAEGTDYTLSYADNLYAGTAKIVVTAMEGTEWTGSAEVTFEILRGVPIVKPTVSDDTYYEGDRVPWLQLQKGSTDGNIYWSGENVKDALKAGDNVLEWIFKPADENNFMVIGGTMIIYAETTTTQSTVTSTKTSSTVSSTLKTARSTITTTQMTTTDKAGSSQATTTDLTTTSVSFVQSSTISTTVSEPAKTELTTGKNSTEQLISNTTESESKVTSSTTTSETTETSYSSTKKSTTRTLTTPPIGIIFTTTTTKCITTPPSGIIFTTTTTTTATQTTSSEETSKTSSQTTASWITLPTVSAASTTLTADTSVTSGSSTTDESEISSSFTTTTRRIIITTNSKTTLAGQTTTVPRKLPSVVGDADFNGKVEMQDAYWVLLYNSYHSAGDSGYMLYPDDMLINHYLLQLCDVDGNGEMNMLDAYWILLYTSYHAAGGKQTWDEVLNSGA